MSEIIGGLAIGCLFIAIFGSLAAFFIGIVLMVISLIID